MNIINRYEERTKNTSGEEREYGFVDIGHSGTTLHIFKGARHQATRVIEYGVSMLDSIIAELRGVDEHIAKAYKHANNNGELSYELCESVYGNIALELTRAVNFHRFNTPDSNLNDLYLCGGGSLIEPLRARLRDEVPLDIHSFTELLPDSSADDDELALCQMAIGAAMQ